MKFRCLIPFLTFFFLLPGCRTKTREPKLPPLTPEQTQLNVQSFDRVWTTIKDKHFDPKLNGADWDGARVELRPKIEHAKTMAEARAVMGDLIGRLKQTHFGIIPKEAYKDMPGSDKREITGTSGISIRMADGLPCVWRVHPASAAYQAGVKPGWVVESVDGKKVSELQEKLKDLPIEDSMKSVYQIIAVAQAMSGNAGDARTIVFRNDKDASVSKTLTLEKPAGVPARLGSLPTFYVEFEAKEVAPKIGYISLTAFFDPMNVGPGFKKAIERFEKADGLIIDLRGNPGGIGAMAMGFGGYLVDKPDLKLGVMSTRDTKVNFALNPQPTTFNGPLAILVDELSMSTSEILAGGLQDLGRARIFGAKTPGAALPSTVEMLPNGDGFQYAFANYVSYKGEPLEGKGVEPDEIIPLHRDALLAGGDPVIDAAIGWIGCEKHE
jgi:carboxyl-terminal processing protease